LDPLTHTLTGVMLGRIGLERWTPHATWILVLAANAPDCDAVMWLGGSLSYLNWHRHITHALLMIPVMALLPVLLLRFAFRVRLPWRRAYAISLMGAATHPMLDSLNTYGIRLGLPFTSHWYALDLTYVIDLWITAALVAAALAPMLSRLVGDEIGAARRASGRGWAYCALVFLVLYGGARGVLHQRAVALIESRLYQGVEPRTSAAFPDPFRPWLWHGLVETDDFYAMPEVDLLGAFDPESARVIFKAKASPAIEQARQAGPVSNFLRFARYPWWSETPVTSPPDGVRVSVTDLRFTDPATRWRFVATATFDGERRLVDSDFRFEP
jgi:inner membrane protein